MTATEKVEAAIKRVLDYEPAPAVKKGIRYQCVVCKVILSRRGVERHGRECQGYNRANE